MKYNAFYACASLKSILLPENVTSIVDGNANYGCFQNCTSLQYIRAKNVTYIGRAAFMNCSSLDKVDITWENVTVIGRDSFYGCVSLVIDNPNFSNVKTLSQSAFNGCTSFEIGNLYLPSLETISVNSLIGVKVRRISSLGKATELPNIGCDTLILEEVNLCNVIDIAAGVFENCTKLVQVRGLENVVNLGAHAFYGCSSLTMDIDLSSITSSLINGNFAKSGIKSVICHASVLGRSSGEGPFAYCTNLRSAILPYITTLGDWSFRFCSSLNYVMLGDSTTTINSAVFAYCEALEVFICKSITPPALANQVFAKTNETFIIYVPDESVGIYQTATNWNAFASRIKPMSEYIV